jgi:hypothetical protein
MLTWVVAAWFVSADASSSIAGIELYVRFMLSPSWRRSIREAFCSRRSAAARTARRPGDTFDDEETDLLTGVVDDLVYRIGALRMRAGIDLTQSARLATG